MPHDSTSRQIAASISRTALLLAATAAWTVLPLQLDSPRADAQVVLGAHTAGAGTEIGSTLESFAATSGATPKIAMYYQDWNESWKTALVDPRVVDSIQEHGSVPMITWMPKLDGRPVDDSSYAPGLIAEGTYDKYIRRAAHEATTYGAPLFIRLAHEMNGNWSPWGSIPGNTPADYIAMWRHVVTLFREEGATNVKWVWAPNVKQGHSSEPFDAYYPGDDWVDFVGLDGYNWGTVGGSWQSFAKVFMSSYEELNQLTKKPMMITETASSESGGNKAQWIREILQTVLTKMPRVRALIWFDVSKETDWQITSTPASESAFRELATSSLLQGTVAELLSQAEVSTPPPLPVLNVGDPSGSSRNADTLYVPVSLTAPARHTVVAKYVLRARRGHRSRVSRGHLRIRKGHRATRLWLGTRLTNQVRAKRYKVVLSSPRNAKIGQRISRGLLGRTSPAHFQSIDRAEQLG